MTAPVVVRVPATSANVGPGFDAFGLALACHLVVGVVEHTSPRVTASGLGADEVSGGDDNLVWRAFVEFCDHVGVPVPSVALRTHNAIPLERGLGSSSAAIVAGLAAARAVTGVTFGDLDLVRLATSMEGHPDNVAPAVLGGFVACVVDDAGELVIRRVTPAATDAVALVPAARQRTDESRGGLPDTVSRADLVAQAARAGHVLGAVAGLWPVAPGAAGDRLHEVVRLPRWGPMAGALTMLRDAGVHAWLSGSGPSVLALIPRLPGHVRDTLTELDVDEVKLRVDRAGTITCAAGGCAFGSGGTCVQCPRDLV